MKTGGKPLLLWYIQLFHKIHMAIGKLTKKKTACPPSTTLLPVLFVILWTREHKCFRGSYLYIKERGKTFVALKWKGLME